MAKTLNSKTERKAKPAPVQETFSLVSNEKLLAIYIAMVKCRMLEQRATLLFQQGKLASDLHASSGREAASAAIAIDLQFNDTLSIAAGEWLPAFVKGLALDALFHALASPADLDQRNILTGDDAHRADAVRESALAAQTAKEGAIVTAILPSAKGSLKPWHSVIASAASQKLPVIFVHYAENESQSSQPPARGKAKNPEALFHGVPAIAVDVFDAVAVYRVACEAIIRARQGRGATLLECAEHIDTPDPSSPNGEASLAGPPPASDPVASMENYLKRKGIEPEQHKPEIVAAFNRDLELATRFLEH